MKRNDARNSGKPATESDAADGSAIFYVVDSRSKPFDLGVELPAQALLTKDAGEEPPIPAGTRITLVQAEILDDSSVLLGFIYAGGLGICTLGEIIIESDFESAETVELGSPIDVRELAFKLLEAAKQTLQRDKYLIPVAFLITSGNPIRLPLSFEAAQKKSVYARLVDLAQAHRALAIVTVNDAYFSRESDHLEDYYDGQLAATNAPEGIWITVSGPAIRSWSITSKYSRTGEEIVFGPDEESLQYTLTLLEGWASDKIPPSN